MDQAALTASARKHLEKFCVEIPTRRVGSQGNRDATVYFRETIAAFGFQAEAQPFPCYDLRLGEIELVCGTRRFEAHISPYSLGCTVSAPLVVASTIDELAAADVAGKLLLLHGPIAREQLIPRYFEFYKPEEHQRIYQLLDEKQPAAIVAATERNPELAGAVYPFPLIEDGDFDIPSAYMTSDEGRSLAACAGQVVSLRMDAERIPALAENVSAFKGSSFENRLLVCAHIDAKPGSPGAADNGGGTTVLLLLAELLRNYQGSRGIEILAINGEDHYSAGGEMEYLRRHRDALGQIGLVINLDGVGLSGDPTGLSSYECPEAISAAALKVASSFPSIRQMDPWFQGDHMVFAMNGVPALALTTCGFLRMESDYAHTSKDNIEIMDAALLADAALFLEKLIDEVLP